MGKTDELRERNGGRVEEVQPKGGCGLVVDAGVQPITG